MNDNAMRKAAERPAAAGGLRGALWDRRSKWGKFGVLMAAIVVLSTAASLVARLTVFKPVMTPFYHIALIAPLSGPNAAIGGSLRDGAQLHIDEVNAAGGLDGALLAMDVFDDRGQPSVARDIAETIARRSDVVAVIGPVSNSAAEAAAQVLERAQIPMIVPTHAQIFAPPHAWSFSIGYSANDETRFLANYIRNVSGDVLTSIVAEEPDFNASADLFQATFERFGVPIKHRWTFDAGTPGFAARLSAIADEVKGATDSGTLYLAMNAGEAAAFVKVLRDKGVNNKLVGPNQIGTRAFAEGFATPDYDNYANGITTSAPLLFDTADKQALLFRGLYLATHQVEPDWVAAFGNESVHIVTEAVRGLRTPAATVAGARGPLREYLASRGQANGVAGLSGATAFDANGIAAKPIQVGVYDGRNLVSALTQLQPIGPDEVGNYIQAVREGRALYVNDRFMYKTNVVYTGLMVQDIRSFDRETGIYEMDFIVWFRYRGDFQPQDVVFANAVEPVKLENPNRTEKVGELNYLSYHVVGKFHANFLDVAQDYGTDLLGTSFRHRILDRNNLLYVVDVIGMGLVGDNSLLSKLRDSNALSPSLGMVLDRGWIPQDIVRSDGLGALTFVGHGKPQPDFSQITLGAVTLNGAPSLRDFVPNEYLIYILIFALIGSVFAVVMDRKREGARLFWNFQSWMLRAICWPLLLISAGSLILNLAFDRLEFYYVDMLVLIYRSLWWIVPAALVTIALERFVWRPLEKRADRKVPGSVRAMAKLLVYVFAGFGVVGFVFDQPLTSLLATSGVLSLVIGLAIQGNISNIFSGIVLNIERPFQVGDILRLQDGTEAEVIDITWRSIRVRSELGHVYSIPNSVATEAEMIRVTRAHGETYRMQDTVHVSPAHDPKHVTALIRQALASVGSVSAMPPPEVRFSGTGGTQYAAYNVIFSSADYEESYDTLTDVWHAIWQALNEEGIPMGPQSAPKVRPLAAAE